MKLIDRIALVLVILGGLNWGCVGIFGLDLVAALFGGSASVLSRVVYVLICLAALWSITLFFREDPVERRAKGNARDQKSAYRKFGGTRFSSRLFPIRTKEFLNTCPGNRRRRRWRTCPGRSRCRAGWR